MKTQYLVWRARCCLTFLGGWLYGCGCIKCLCLFRWFGRVFFCNSKLGTCWLALYHRMVSGRLLLMEITLISLWGYYLPWKMGKKTPVTWSLQPRWLGMGTLWDVQHWTAPWLNLMEHFQPSSANPYYRPLGNFFCLPVLQSPHL